MELEISPEPSDEERAALEAALARVEDVADGEPEAFRSRWREAALTEASPNAYEVP